MHQHKKRTNPLDVRFEFCTILKEKQFYSEFQKIELKGMNSMSKSNEYKCTLFL